VDRAASQSPETVETVPGVVALPVTWLKPGVNEMSNDVPGYAFH